MVGTPLYMAPEPCKGSGQIDDRADVYSLGVMLYRMLCGRPPFIGEGAGAVMAMHIYEPTPLLRDFEPSIPEELAALVHRLLVKDPSQRPPMLQVAQTLEQFKNIHTTGMLSAIEMSRLSGAINSITPLPTPALLGGSGSNQAASHQLNVSHISLQHTGVGHTSGGNATAGSNSVSQTFGHSAAQISAEPKRRGVMVEVATVGASVLLGAALFSIVALRSPEKKLDSPTGPHDG